MKNAIILHGKPGKDEYYDNAQPSCSNAQWLPWLQKQLLVQGIKADTPEVPLAYDPQWELWVREVERFEIGPETMLVGHSCGGGFWIKYLSLHKELKVGKVVLVAPWIDPERKHTKNFFDNFEIDSNLVSRTGGITIFGSDNDETSVQKSITILRGKIPNITYREFHNYGHFCASDMGTNEFPELLMELVN